MAFVTLWVAQVSVYRQTFWCLFPKGDLFCQM